MASMRSDGVTGCSVTWSSLVHTCENLVMSRAGGGEGGREAVVVVEEVEVDMEENIHGIVKCRRGV